MEQARIQASLDTLRDEKEKDAAIAEANTLVAGLQDMGFEVRSEVNSPVPQAIKEQRTAAYISAQASLRSKGSFTITESENAPPAVHLSQPQRTKAIPLALHPPNANKDQAAASDAIMPQQIPQASRSSGELLRQGFTQPHYTSPAPEPSGALPQHNVKQDSASPAHPSVHWTPYGASHDHSATT